jgi:hypothetical protein
VQISASINNGASLNRVACPTTSRCAAVGPGGVEITFSPLSPGVPTPTVIGNGVEHGLSCPSASQCTAVDGTGQEETFNPASPATSTKVSIDAAILESVDCPSTSQCTAVDFSGSEVTFNPTAPGTPTPVPLTMPGQIYGLACPSSSRCVAVDTVGDELTFNPHAVGTPSPVSITTSALIGLACPAAGQCIAVGQGGRVVAFNPAAPGSAAASTIAGASSLNAIACASVAECAAADHVGKGFIGFSAPLGTAPPSISGTPKLARTLTERHGSWIGVPTGYLYRWQRCKSNGTGCTAIAHATAQHYTLTASDVGHRIRVQEISINPGGSSAPATSAATAVVKASAPVLSRLRIKPASFKAAKHGGSIARRGASGAKISYRDSQAAHIVFTVRRPEPGVRHGKRCVAGPTHGSGGHARRCTRYVALGRFTRVDRAGANSFHFTGRLGGRALGAGLYRLDAVARELGLSSRTISARFRIR